MEWNGADEKELRKLLELKTVKERIRADQFHPQPQTNRKPPSRATSVGRLWLVGWEG
jgi:hypothetical protein